MDSTLFLGLKHLFNCIRAKASEIQKNKSSVKISHKCVTLVKPESWERVTGRGITSAMWMGKYIWNLNIKTKGWFSKGWMLWDLWMIYEYEMKTPALPSGHEQNWKQSCVCECVCVWYIPSRISMLPKWFSIGYKAMFLFLWFCFETLDEHMYVGFHHNLRTQCLQRSLSLYVSSNTIHLTVWKVFFV